MIVIKILISLAIAGAGVYVLMHVNTLARRLQSLYVRQATQVQEKKGWSSYLFIYNPQIWQTPFAWFLFKSGVIFLGIWLILLAYPIVFGPIVL